MPEVLKPGSPDVAPAPLPLVTLVLPAYNEASILDAHLNILADYLKGLEGRYRWEMVIVDDGSKDATGAIADAFAASRTNVQVVHHVTNMNLGQALRTGFARCRGDYVVVLDIDLSYEPDHIEKMLRTLEDTVADIVVASPYMPGGHVSHVPRARLVLSKGANRFLTYFAPQANVRTITGMVRAYRREFLKSLDLRALGVDINSEIIYKGMLLRGRIIEIPAHLDWSRQRQKGKAGKTRVSSFRIYRGIVTYLLEGFFFRPFMFFFLPGIALFAASLYMITWIFINVGRVYVTLPVMQDSFDGRFSAAVAQAFQQRPHAFLVGGIALLSSLQLVSLGIMALQTKRYFEELFHITSTIRKNVVTPEGSD